jgi:hypothetical protein
MAQKKKASIHPTIRQLLGYSSTQPDHAVLRHWKNRATRVCKPCWELRYCPYGPLVEQSPLLPGTRTEAIAHNNYLKECLRTGALADGRRFGVTKRNSFQEQVKAFNPQDYPETIPPAIAEMQCTVFGHVCPVVFAAEGFTETVEGRRTGRYVPFRVKMRVVRRDNYTCQHCNKHLQDNEVEFDHIVPISKGGSSDEHNIRLTCHECNADKSDRVDI